MARALSIYVFMYQGDAVQIGSFKMMIAKIGVMMVVVVVMYSEQRYLVESNCADS